VIVPYEGCRFAPEGESGLNCDKYKRFKDVLCDKDLGDGKERGRPFDCFSRMMHQEDGTPETKRLNYVDEAGTGNTHRLKRRPE